MLFSPYKTEPVEGEKPSPASTMLVALRTLLDGCANTMEKLEEAVNILLGIDPGQCEQFSDPTQVEEKPKEQKDN